MNILHFAFGAFFQTKDNNISIENQLENETLTDDFEDRKTELLVKNQLETIKELRNYIKKRYEKDRLLITDKQAAIEAADLYRIYRENGYIDDWCHLSGWVKDTLKEALEG